LVICNWSSISFSEKLRLKFGQTWSPAEIPVFELSEFGDFLIFCYFLYQDKSKGLKIAKKLSSLNINIHPRKPKKKSAVIGYGFYKCLIFIKIG